jgi:hypothetical protein
MIVSMAGAHGRSEAVEYNPFPWILDQHHFLEKGFFLQSKFRFLSDGYVDEVDEGNVVRSGRPTDTVFSQVCCARASDKNKTIIPPSGGKPNIKAWSIPHSFRQKMV